MKILLWHGYLLTGSGSNVYTANVAREWRSAGHDVVIMCQGRRTSELGFVDEELEVDALRIDAAVRRVSAERGRDVEEES